jgi:hypothetical protein
VIKGRRPSVGDLRALNLQSCYVSTKCDFVTFALARSPSMYSAPHLHHFGQFGQALRLTHAFSEVVTTVLRFSP